MTYLSSFFLLLFSFSTLSISITEDYEQKFKEAVVSHYESAEHGNFKGKNGVNIHYLHYKEISKPILVISPGLGEPAAKYSELSYDLRSDYDIYIIDHRGQGASERLIHNQRLYVKNFQYYVDDLATFIKDVVQKDNESNKKVYLFAHSMGGLIGAMYLSQNPQIDKAIINAPMLKLKQELPIKLFIFFKSKKMRNNPKELAPKNEEFNFSQKLTLADAKLKSTHSPKRWKMLRHMTLREPELAAKGISNAWLLTSIETTKKSTKLKSKTPFLLFQAGKEDYVKNKALNEWCENNKETCTMVDKDFSEARHEIFNEVDTYRDLAIKKLKAYFE